MINKSTFSNIRTKIDTLISRSTPVPDPDAPEDPESVRFWATSDGEFSERERTKVSATATARVTPTTDGLAAMAHLDVPGAGGAAVTPCGNGPTLKSLVDVANSSEPMQTGPTPKCKAKAKAKAKVTQQSPKTPAEQRAAIRFWDSIRFSVYVVILSNVKESVCDFVGV